MMLQCLKSSTLLKILHVAYHSLTRKGNWNGEFMSLIFGKYLTPSRARCWALGAEVNKRVSSVLCSARMFKWIIPSSGQGWVSARSEPVQFCAGNGACTEGGGALQLCRPVRQGRPREKRECGAFRRSSGPRSQAHGHG